MNQKNKQLYHSKNYKILPKWDLRDLYKSPGSKEIQKDLIFLRKNSILFEKKYFKKVSKLSSKKLYYAILELEKIDMVMDKIISYAHLLVSENINHEKNNIFYQEIKEKITNYSSSIILYPI